MKKIFATLLCLMLCSCMTDYVGTSEIEYKNNSSYDIQVLTVNQSLSADKQDIIETEDVLVTIPKGETYTLRSSEHVSKDGYVSWYTILVLNRIAYIQFGESVKIDFSGSKYGDETTYNLASEKQRYRKYTYTFTDADYQFALENGTQLEN